MSNRTIIDFLNEQAREGLGAGSGPHISFHMPGHKGRSSIYNSTGYGDFVRNFMSCDITEIPGADALFCPETTIKSVMDNYADLYDVDHTELLVNGSSAGLMAAIMGTVPLGGKLILGRNSHFSAFSALRLGGIIPAYVRPEIDEKTGLVSEISPEELEYACEDNPEATAILVTSPNYYGVLSDIGRLASIAHEHNMLLIVDQAHGAHLKFFDYDAEKLKANGEYVPYPKHSAESLGADIVINSTHKTLLSFTSTAILNFCSDRFDHTAVASMLRMLQTTSPSYLLMGSLDVNEHVMHEHGMDIVESWKEDIEWFYKRAVRIPGLTVIGGEHFVSAGGNEAQPIFAMYRHPAGLDYTKINISMLALGLDGSRLEAELRNRNIIVEMVHGDYVMLMTGAGNIRSDYEALLDALKDISDSYGFIDTRLMNNSYGMQKSINDYVLDSTDVPLEGEYIPLYEADGRVLYDPVIVYPPGTPVACPGEILTIEAITYIARAIERGEKVSGVDEEGNVKVGVIW